MENINFIQLKENEFLAPLCITHFGIKGPAETEFILDDEIYKIGEKGFLEFDNIEIPLKNKIVCPKNCLINLFVEEVDNIG